ncbi:MAG: leucyl aminopeptidase family protein [Fimbriimonadaceae bacterium]|nr:leucyl aminopeptidase family protein [Fimbriimonadaceae bacterium]
MPTTFTHGRAGRPDAIVILQFADSRPSIGFEPEVVEALRRLEWDGDPGQVVEAFPANGPRVFVLGLGKSAAFTLKSAHKAFAALGRRLAKAKLEAVHIESDAVESADMAGRVCGEALGLLSWTPAEHKGTGTPADPAVETKVCGLQEAFDRALTTGFALAASANYARSLANTPPNVATPLWMAEQATKLAGQFGLDVKVVAGDALAKEGLVGLETVGRASVNPPCLVQVTYTPQGGSGAPVVLLGKTITFDTGGLSIKDRMGMRGMKGDKAGGCAVLGAMHAVATVVKPSFPVVGLLVCAENSVGSDAVRPDDVVTYRDGTTVEVTNTDAEGRLVLADGLCWAQDLLAPACVVDIATLTGGVVVALGNVRGGVFANDDALARQLEDAGEATGERLWRLPLDPEYKDQMKSEVADLVNSNLGKGAHAPCAAAFLGAFVKPETRWGHIDMAGMGKVDKPTGAIAPGPTGYGARLLAQFVKEWKA